MVVDWKNVTEDTILRVAFYGRVSTEHEMQLAAFKNQIKWYEDMAERHSNWIIVGGVTAYLDRGITGTQAKKRPNFLRMIEDAKAGKIDMIVTRDVSRFARNTVDALNYVREMRDIGVEVYFVNDNIRSIRDKDGELRLSIMASLAQDESRKISERVKAGQTISRKNGVLYGTSRILGYTRVRSIHDKDKAGKIGDKSVPTFVINPEEAETVKRIYQLYLEGNGLKQIRIQLMKEQRRNSSGEVSWFDSTISRVLSNPMYIGKQKQHKTEVTNYLNGTTMRIPETDQILVDGDFEPIISEEIFNEVQRIKGARSVLSPKKKGGGGKIPQEKWTEKLLCGCGSHFKRYVWRRNQKSAADAIGYACRNRSDNGSADRQKELGMQTENVCSLRSIPGWQIELMGTKVFRGIWQEHYDAVISVFNKMSERDEQAVTTRDNGIRYQEEIKGLEKRLSRLVDLYTEEKIDEAHYLSKYSEYKQEIELKKDLLAKHMATVGEIIEKDAFSKFLEKMRSMVKLSGSTLDEQTVRMFVDKVIVCSDHCFEWLVNVTGDAPYAAPVLFPVRGGTDATVTDIKKYEDAAKNAQEIKEKYYTRAFAFIVSYEMAKDFRKRDGGYVRPTQWQDLIVDVYVRKVTV